MKYLFDWENKNELELKDFVEGFKGFCYFIDYRYTEDDIEKIKDLYVYNIIEMCYNQNKIINYFLEVM